MYNNFHHFWFKISLLIDLPSVCLTASYSIECLASEVFDLPVSLNSSIIFCLTNHTIYSPANSRTSRLSWGYNEQVSTRVLIPLECKQPNLRYSPVNIRRFPAVKTFQFCWNFLMIDDPFATFPCEKLRDLWKLAMDYSFLLLYIPHVLMAHISQYTF